MLSFFHDGPTTVAQAKFEADKNRASNSIDECQIGGPPPPSKLEDRIIFGIVIAAITAGAAFWAVGII